MKGSTILLNGNDPKGRFVEGIIDDTSVPGTIMELKPATEPVNGRHTWRHASVGSNGDRRLVAVLLEDAEQGVVPDINGANAYTAGRRCFLYIPVDGDELNILVKNISGTADAFAIGDKMMIEAASGKLIASTGATVANPFTIMETVSALTADQLCYCMYGGDR